MTINLDVIDEYQDVLHALKTLAFSGVKSIDKNKVEELLNSLNDELLARTNVIEYTPTNHSDDGI